MTGKLNDGQIETEADARQTAAKESDGKPDDVAPDEIRGERTGRDRREVAVEHQAKPPAQQGAQASTSRNRND